MCRRHQYLVANSGNTISRFSSIVIVTSSYLWLSLVTGFLVCGCSGDLTCTKGIAGMGDLLVQ